MRRSFLVMEKGYRDAVKQLYSLQSNAAVIEKWKASRRENKTVNLRDEMLHHLKVLNVDISKLSVVHVAGTKGKGSVVTMTETLLRHHKQKTGMFISPHLVEPRERIRINGKPLSVSQFAFYFWKTYDYLSAAPPSQHPQIPPFFRFLNCMSFLVFQEFKVDVAVVEVGVGGRACSTNVVEPVICGITRLGYDHIDVLGSTLKEIAFEKAGIIKQGVPCFTSTQLDEGKLEMEAQAKARNSVLVTLDSIPGSVQLGLSGVFQSTNAAIALALYRYWMLYHGQQRNELSLAVQTERCKEVVCFGESDLSKIELEALKVAKWRGRAQYVETAFETDVLKLKKGGNMKLFLDGAHTSESVTLALNWFHKNSDSVSPRVLIFNFKPNKQVEDMMALFANCEWDLIICCPSAAQGQHDCSWQKELQGKWPKSRDSKVVIEQNLSEAVQNAVKVNPDGCQFFVTGSLYLVGAMLEYLKWDVDDL